jgi:peptide/nickel transport system substrate-binding protein
MKKLRLPILIAVLAVAAIAILLYTQQQPASPAENIPVGAVPVVEPESGGVYVEGVVGALGRLNPLLDVYNRVDQDVDRLLYSRLLYFDENGLPHGDLADSWGISSDGLIYNFSLRSNATWHDGQPVTSDDIIFTIEMMRSDVSLLTPTQRELWFQVNVERLDEKNIRFILPEAYSPFLENLSFGIVPAHILGDLDFEQITNDHFNLQPVGSGPYRFDKLIIEDGQIKGVTLTPYASYYGAIPYIEQVIFRYYATPADALAAYQQGETMGIGQVTQDILPQVLNEPKMGLQTGLLSSLSIVYLNLDNPDVPFFQDANVRRALLTGLNRQWMIDQVLTGQAVQANGPIFPNSWAYYNGTEHVAYDPTAASNLLRQAGYTLSSGDVRSSEGVTLTFELIFPDDEIHALLAEAIRDDWSTLGLNVTLKALPYDELVGDYLATRNYQAALVDLNLTQSTDPDPYPFWHQAQSVGGQNYAKWDDRPASEYLEQARVLINQTDRLRLYRNFQVRFALELPALPLFYPVYTYGVDNSVQGVRMGPLYSPTDRLNTLPRWFLLAKKSTAPQATATP